MNRKRETGVMNGDLYKGLCVQSRLVCWSLHAPACNKMPADKAVSSLWLEHYHASVTAEACLLEKPSLTKTKRQPNITLTYNLSLRGRGTSWPGHRARAPR